jgi:hypothetical protein
MMSKLAMVMTIGVWLLLGGCGQREASQRSSPQAGAGQESQSTAETTPAPPETAHPSPPSPSEVKETPPPETPAPAAEAGHEAEEPAPDPAASTPEDGAPPKSSPPEPEATTPEESSESSEPASTPHVVDPGGTVQVEATKPGLTRVGAAKCKMCHKVQYESWAASAHAKRTPPLDCESCHGPGSEYRVLSVMKDPQEARAAGLVIPGREFCVTCHRGDWSDEMLARAHAHKQTGDGH